MQQLTSASKFSKLLFSVGCSAAYFPQGDQPKERPSPTLGKRGATNYSTADCRWPIGVYKVVQTETADKALNQVT